jgi:putative flippase GtrA
MFSDRIKQTQNYIKDLFAPENREMTIEVLAFLAVGILGAIATWYGLINVSEGIKVALTALTAYLIAYLNA